MQKKKWLSEEALQIAGKKTEAKDKGTSSQGYGFSSDHVSTMYRSREWS